MKYRENFKYLEERSANYVPQSKSSPLPVFVKVLLKPSHGHSLTYCPQGFALQWQSSELSSYNMINK